MLILPVPARSADNRLPDEGPALAIQVDALCGQLATGIVPDRLHLAWGDNRHPESPLLCDAFVVSMLERSLLERGFELAASPADAFYTLQLSMTPTDGALLVLARLRSPEQVLATAEKRLSTAGHPWRESLNAYRWRTKTRIPIGGAP